MKKKFNVTMLSMRDNQKVFCLAGLAVDIAVLMSNNKLEDIPKRFKRIQEILLIDRTFLGRFNDVQREILDECGVSSGASNLSESEK